MPKYMKYSDFDLAFKGEPTNAAVKSIHYNDASKFKIKSIEEIIWKAWQASAKGV